MASTNFRSLCRYYRKRFPHLRLEVRITARPIGEYGECKPIDGGFRIKLSKRLDEIGLFMVLVHEVAHALSWNIDDHESDHGPHFGAAYAKAWRVYLDWMAE